MKNNAGIYRKTSTQEMENTFHSGEEIIGSGLAQEQMDFTDQL